MSITVVVGAAIAAMLSAVVYGTDSERDMRSMVIKSKTVDGRLSAALRGSKMVLDAGSNFVVLWIDDYNDNGLPNLLEIQRIDLDGGADELSSYETVFPGAWSQATIDANNLEFQLTDDFDAITAALMGASTFPKSLWATNITDWTITLDDADPQLAALVSYRVTLAQGTLTNMTVNAAWLRNSGE